MELLIIILLAVVYGSFLGVVMFVLDCMLG
jgi:hypothetical protein